MDLTYLKKKIYQDFGLPSAKTRREALTSQMKALSDEGKNCFKCNGMCCTFAFNSMQMTPLETVELCIDLESKDRLNEETLEELKACIKEYRLDIDISIGGSKSFRRTYTCPFFKPGAKGCTISLHDKPYGCLGFNPKEVGVSEEGKCKVYVETHESREASFLEDEEKLNKFLISELGLYWEKLPIPMAILELIKKVGK